jgi:hypothetical protein
MSGAPLYNLIIIKNYKIILIFKLFNLIKMFKTINKDSNFKIPKNRNNNRHKNKTCGVCKIPTGSHWTRHWKTWHPNSHPWELTSAGKS